MLLHCVSMLALLLLVHSVAGAPADKKRNIEYVDREAVEISEDAAGDDTAVERMLLDTLGIFESSDASDDPEEEVSVYDSIKDENTSLLTAIERLYNMLHSQRGDHVGQEDPLLDLENTGPHSLTLRIQPRYLHPDTMVLY